MFSAAPKWRAPLITAAKVRKFQVSEGKKNELFISHDVFLWTLSRVINSFITRDKALRGTLCNSTPNPSWGAGAYSIGASDGGSGFYVGLKMQA